MKPVDEYHKWVEWSETDQVYIGKCPDLITGIHGDDPVQVYRELSEVLEEVIDHFHNSGRALPTPRIRPMIRASSSLAVPLLLHATRNASQDS